MPKLWEHPGTSDQQREELVKQLLTEAKVHGTDLVAIEPQPAYRPLFAYIVAKGVSYGRGDWTRTSDPLHPMQVRYQTAPHPDHR